MTIKALIVISSLTHGGAERQVVELANNIDSSLVDLHICSLSRHCPLAEFLNAPQRLYIIEKKSKYDLTVISRLRRLIKQHQFDIVHGFLFDAEIATRVAGKLCGITVIGSERNSSNNYSSIKRKLYKRTASMMDLCIANSSAGAEFSQSYFNIPKNKYTVIHNGVDTDRFSPRTSKVNKSDLGINSEDMLIAGMFASYKKQKNHIYLLQAIAELKHRLQGVRFLFVGSVITEGDDSSIAYHETVMTTAEQLDVMDYCLFLDARNDVEELYNLCSITILPSLHEGTPNVALESMACGVPVIATDVADNKEVIPNQKAGFIVPLNQPKLLADRIHTAMTEHTLRKEMSAFALQWVNENYSLKRLAEKYAHTYQQVLADKK